MKKNVLITGGSGFIGKKLTELLQRNGYSVSILTRKGGNFGNVKTFKWDPENDMIEEGALEGLYAIVHLAGAGIADKKWTRKRKNEILNSRVETAALIHRKLKEISEKPDLFLSSSAVGYYGYDTGSLLVKEKSRPGDDFLATVCKEWEQAAETFNDLAMRVVKLRVGFVLSDEGGALPVMMRPVNFGLGAALGSSDQFMSWIHIDDLIRIYMAALDNPAMEGAYNAVGPAPVTNKEMMRTLAKVMDRPFFLPNVPGFVLRMAMGEMASIVTGGNRVSSEKIESTGFKFYHTDLWGALENLLNS